MKRKVLLVGLMMGLMLGVLAPVAHSEGFSAGIEFCLNGGSPCYDGFRGISADMAVFDPNLGCRTNPNHQIVSSVYIAYQDGTSDLDFVEFGWYQNRNGLCGYRQKTLFIKVLVHSGLVTNETTCHNPNGGDSYSADAPANGTYRFTIYQESGAPGTYKFKYTWTDGSHLVTVPCSLHAYFARGYGETSLELADPADLDDADCAKHGNVWLQNYNFYPPTNWGWAPANTSYFGSMVQFNDGLNNWTAFRTAGNGLTGDSLAYSGGGGAC